MGIQERDYLEPRREIRVDLQPRESSLEGAMSINGNSVLFAWDRSYGNVFNPSESLLKYFLDGGLPEANPHSKNALLFSLQFEGACAANCKECVFANKRVNDLLEGEDVPFLARSVDPQTMQDLIYVSEQVAEERSILSPGERYRANAVLAGDPSFNRYTPELIFSIATNTRISASRWSTIGVKTSNNPLTSFEQAAYAIKSTGGLDHKLGFQVSLHSTDTDERRRHVTHYSPNSRINLIPVDEINDSFQRIKSITGRSSTLSFVVHKDSVIDPQILSNQFDTRSTIISLRPIIQTNGQTNIAMPQLRFFELYTEIRSKGFNVVIMPTNDGGEQVNMITGSKPTWDHTHPSPPLWPQ